MGENKLVLLPSPAVGHIITMVEMGKLLFRRHSDTSAAHFSITILLPGPASAPAVDACINSVEASGLDIEFRRLPRVDPPTDNDGPEDFTSLLMQKLMPHVKYAVADIQRLSAAPVAALIVDFYATGALDFTRELGVPCYVYFTTSAAFLALMLYLPTLHENFPMEFEEMEEAVHIPGVCPILPLSMPAPFMSKKSGRYTCFVHHGRRFCELDGIIINTFAELQPETLRAVEKGLCVPGRWMPPVFPVGTVLASHVDGGGASNGRLRRHECLAWLDEQPAGSVVFLCFGSRGSFEAVQVAEMAKGLERSGHRFLWALRVASLKEAELVMRQPEEPSRLEEVLPKGFTERTKGRGMVLVSWAPQADILAHLAVRGFVTHCGWNSCLESLWFGVPMLGWPLYAEQHLNAVVMAEDMGVALRLEVEREKGNWVGAEELERGVGKLMGEGEEGRRVRAKAKEMMAASRRAGEEGGSSFVTMKKLLVELLTKRAP
ncbi:anthocyanidin 3-O-glucosyltransferase 2-like [Zingiber officinale]|uniref:Glycosyltransferase n=1 Tax=Zingiber officinale TaxID=94328 RepID=A0A8J5LK79_ZINOF|nr:anthocyanidin 3-O-glucosyltransferase 2-like [Zingiber officinale]KAG6519078.1 hypothetical protein ZIOFF_022567 [Zingiber officinale]